MKNFILFFFLPLFIFSQEHGKSGVPYDKTKAIEPLIFQDVIEVPNIAGELIYKKMLEWSADNFRDDEAAISYKDSDIKMIKGKSGFYVIYDGLTAKDFSGKIKFDFKFEVKDGKLRYTFDNIGHYATETVGYYHFGLISVDEKCPYDIPWHNEKTENRFWGLVKEDIFKTFVPLINSIIEYVSSLENEEDW